MKQIHTYDVSLYQPGEFVYTVAGIKATSTTEAISQAKAQAKERMGWTKAKLSSLKRYADAPPAVQVMATAMDTVHALMGVPA